MAPLTEHDRARLARTWRVVAIGPGLGLAAAAAVGVAGGSGGAGLAVLLAVVSATTIAAAMMTSLQLLLDEFRRRPVALRRLWTALGLFVAGLLLLVLATGALG